MAAWHDTGGEEGTLGLALLGAWWLGTYKKAGDVDFRFLQIGKGVAGAWVFHSLEKVPNQPMVQKWGATSPPPRSLRSHFNFRHLSVEEQ